MRDVLATDFSYIEIAKSARTACFPAILGVYQIIIWNLLTLLEPVHLPIMNRQKIINLL